MKILTAAQMSCIDRLTTQQFGVPSLTLMENAGRGIVEFLAERFAPLDTQRVAIVCGLGNNGGDGLVVARLLRERGMAPHVVLLAEPSSLRDDAAHQLERLAAQGAPEVAPNVDAWRALKVTF